MPSSGPSLAKARQVSTPSQLNSRVRAAFNAFKGVVLITSCRRKKQDKVSLPPAEKHYN
jgi:hypothetical protein